MLSFLTYQYFLLSVLSIVLQYVTIGSVSYFEKTFFFFHLIFYCFFVCFVATHTHTHTHTNYTHVTQKTETTHKRNTKQKSEPFGGCESAIRLRIILAVL